MAAAREVALAQAEVWEPEGESVSESVSGTALGAVSALGLGLVRVRALMREPPDR